MLGLSASRGRIKKIKRQSILHRQNPQTQGAESCVSTLIFVTPEELPSPTPSVVLALSGVRRKCKSPASRLVFISVVCLRKVTVRVLLLSGWLLLASHPSAKSPWLPADPAQPAGVAEAPRPPYTSATGTSRSVSWIWGMRLFPTFKNCFERDEGRNPSFQPFFFFFFQTASNLFTSWHCL